MDKASFFTPISPKILMLIFTFLFGMDAFANIGKSKTSELQISCSHAFHSGTALSVLEKKSSEATYWIDQEVPQSSIIENYFHRHEVRSDDLHFFTHGRPGELLIEGQWRSEKEIADWLDQRNILTGKKQLHIYGCNFARGKAGQKAVAYLESKLGIAVSASDDLTGKNGDWQLEVGKTSDVVEIEQYPYTLQCPVLNANGVFDKEEDIVWTTYHGHLAKGVEGVITWGEDMSSNATDIDSMVVVDSTNGYNYTGSPLMFCATGNADAQAFLLTTTNLYSWGATTEVVGGTIVSNDTFSLMTMPGGVTSADVLDIKSNNGVFFLVTVSGNVWVAGQNVTQVSGNTSTTANTWHEVEVSLGNPITGVVELTGSREVVYVRKSDNTLWAWGRGVALAGGAASQNLTYATEMDTTALPGGVTLSQLGTYMDNLANTSGLLAVGSDGKLYGVGYNGGGELIDSTSGFINDWTTVKDSTGSDLTNVVFLSTSDNTEEYASASIITTVVAANNNLFTWGESNTDNIGQGPNGLIDNPRVPMGFTPGTDNPVYTSVGGHATSYLNSNSGGTICFVGHVSNGSGAGLQTNPDFFECFGPDDTGWPLNISLCIQAIYLANDDQDSTPINTAIAIDVVANDGTSLDTTTVATGGGLLAPANGSITGVNPTTGAITYMPNSAYTGIDSFEYEICANGGTPCDTAKVFVTVYAVPCNSVSNLITDRTICSGGLIDTLAVITTYPNPDSIAFVYFSSPQTDSAFIYSGGTGLDTTQISIGNDTVRVLNVSGLTNPGSTPDTIYVYAIVLPAPPDSTCRPYEEILVIVNPLSTGNESYNGCSGDGYSVNVNGMLYDEATPSGTEILTNAYGCDSTVTVNLTFNVCEIGVAKNLSSSVDNGDGSFTITYDLVVENLGVTTLDSLVLTDTVSNTSGPFAGFLPTGFSTTAGTLLTANSSWDGTPSSNILNDFQSLAAGARDTLGIRFTVTPVSTTPVNNQALIEAKSLNSYLVNDISDEGFEPDTDGDQVGNESISGGGDSDENDPTITTFSCSVIRTGRINLTKN